MAFNEQCCSIFYLTLSLFVTRLGLLFGGKKEKASSFRIYQHFLTQFFCNEKRNLEITFFRIKMFSVVVHSGNLTTWGSPTISAWFDAFKLRNLFKKYQKITNQRYKTLDSYFQRHKNSQSWNKIESSLQRVS